MEILGKHIKLLCSAAGAAAWKYVQHVTECTLLRTWRAKDFYCDTRIVALHIDCAIWEIGFLWNRCLHNHDDEDCEDKCGVSTVDILTMYETVIFVEEMWEKAINSSPLRKWIRQFCWRQCALTMKISLTLGWDCPYIVLSTLPPDIYIQQQHSQSWNWCVDQWIQEMESSAYKYKWCHAFIKCISKCEKLFNYIN